MVNDGKYVHLWQKYRPAILNLMVASAKGNQSYKLSNHEFIDISPSKVSGYSFIMRIYQGKSISNIKTSITAPDLLYVLKNSGKAMELSQTNIYEFELDKSFTLHIRFEQPPEAPETSDTPETPEKSEE